MAIARIEPLEFFTKDALKAGWYLAWRLWVWLVAIYAGAGILAAVTMPFAGRAAAGLIFGLVVIGTIYPVIRLTNKFAGQWAMRRYGLPLEHGVWWGITWRSMLVSLAMNVGIAVVQVLFKGTFAIVAHLASFVLGLAQIVLLLQTQGWAMSVMVSRQLGGIEPSDTDIVDAETDPDATVILTDTARESRARNAAPMRAPQPPAAGRPRHTPPARVAGDTLACPKCGQPEILQGKVIGRYCGVCGWRESQG